MNSIIKKTVACSLIGMMQLGWGVATLEASPRQDWRAPRYEKCNLTKAQRIRAENERHRHEMQRRQHENAWAWRERQKREKEHHEEVMRMIGGLALLTIILNNANNNEN